MKRNKIKIEVELDAAMVGICSALGIEPQELFQKLQNDLIGDSNKFLEDDRLLLHLYICQSVANKEKIERSKVEDLLAHLVSLKNQYERDNYTYLVNGLFKDHQVFCDYCKNVELIKSK